MNINQSDEWGPAVGQLTAVDDIDLSTMPSTNEWVPRWLVEFGKDDKVGIAIDDHCVVVLIKNAVGQWRPSSWIPREVAERLPEFAQYA